jgi:sigma-B regulation protein RsbQ
VFVHGFGTDRHAWDAVAAAFGAEHRLVTFDNAGTRDAAPGSFAQHRYLDLQGYVADTLAILDALGIRGAVLVGHSMGAMIAALCAIARPDCCAKLVMIGASPHYLDAPGYSGGISAADLNAIYSAINGAYADWARDLAPRAMANPDRPQLASRFAEQLLAIPAERAYTVLCSIFQSDYREDVARITQPTLLIQSRDDLFVPASVAEFLREKIPHSTLVHIDAEGHLPHVSAPRAVIDAMRTFLA